MKKLKADRAHPCNYPHTPTDYRHTYSHLGFHWGPFLSCISALCLFVLLFHAKNLGRLWLAYTELQGDFTCFNSYLLTLGTLYSQNFIPVSNKDLGLLWHQQLLERIMGTYWLKVPNILSVYKDTVIFLVRSLAFQQYCPDLCWGSLSYQST